MTINLQKPDIRELKPKITVFGVGGGGGNAVNNMINGGLQGVEFVVANTDAQALTMSRAQRMIQLGVDVTQGLGAGSQPEVGRASAEECIDEIADHLQGTHMAFITAGMGGGTGTGAAPVVARAARELGILTVGVVTKPFHFEGARRMKTAEAGITELQKNVDTLIVIPNQNLFRIANDKTTFADAFGMADQVLYSGVACITDLMVKEGLINLDFADVRSVMREMGKAMMGTGESSGEGRAMQAAEAAIANPLLDETSMRGARGLLISITGGRDMTLFEVDEAATRIREEVDADANIILGATFDEALEGVIRVSVVATGIDRTQEMAQQGGGDRVANAISRSAPGGVQLPRAAAPVSRPAVSVPLTGSSTLGAMPRVDEEKVQKVAEALATPARTVAQKDGVRIEPFRPAAPEFADDSLEDDFREALEGELMPLTDQFIPDEAEMPEVPVRSARMPDVEDFPPMVRAEMEKREAPVAPAEEERGPIGLLRKLTHGFSSAHHAAEPARAQQQAPQPAPKPVQQSVQRQEPVMRPATEARPQPSHQPAHQPSGNGRVDDNPFAPRRAQLDPHGRPAASARPIDDDDQLDIPAFLRRQGS
ncbi:MAG: cell division protein FtsZ [Rhizobiaceae bacterium]